MTFTQKNSNFQNFVFVKMFVTVRLEVRRDIGGRLCASRFRLDQKLATLGASQQASRELWEF